LKVSLLRLEYHIPVLKTSKNSNVATDSDMESWDKLVANR